MKKKRKRKGKKEARSKLLNLALGRHLFKGRLLGSSWPSFGCIMVVLARPWLDFGSLGDPQTWILHGFGGMFGHRSVTLAKDPAGFRFLLFVSTLQHGGTCEAQVTK